MSIISTIKSKLPKTKKGWLLLTAGGGAAALGANYLYVGRDRAWITQIWGMFGGGHAPPHGHPHHPHRGPAPHRPMQMPMQQPMMPMQPMQQPMVYVEPTPEAYPFFYEYRNHGMHHPGVHHPHGWPRHSYAGPSGFDFHSHHYAHPHVAGAPPSEAAPGAPRQTRAKIPPPGAFGVVSDSTPEAEGIVDMTMVGYGWEPE